MKSAKFLFVLFVLFIVIAGGYGGWKLERYLNYKWSYESNVQKTIDTTIKPLTERIQHLEIEVRTTLHYENDLSSTNNLQSGTEHINYDIFTIDGCQYIKYGRGIVHKGNCTNSFHKIFKR